MHIRPKLRICHGTDNGTRQTNYFGIEEAEASVSGLNFRAYVQARRNSDHIPPF